MSGQSNYKFYQLLGCPVDSTQDELKRAYHKLALLHHPDKNSVDASTERFLEIEEAWRILGNPEARKKYDAQCRQAELESENILIYDRIHLKDLKTKGEVSFPCRCGSNYLVNKSDLVGDDATVYISCQECTFFIAIDR